MPRLFALLLLLSLALAHPAAAQTQPIPTPAPPALGAESYILMDFHSGRVLVDEQSDLRRDPASLTKVMTAFVTFSELKAGNMTLDEQVRVSERAWRAPGSRMFIEVGDRVSVENLLRGMIIQSGNDASVALAEHIAGTEATFAELMNQYARELGMADTHYTNAAGLPDPEHYSTAADTARLVRALIERFPDYYDYYSQRAFTWNDIEQFNRNRMLWQDETVDGVKTGYTETAGYCLATSADRDGMRLISVVMGADNPEARVEQSKALLNYGYRFFETHRLYAAGEAIETPRIWKGQADNLPVGVTQDLFVTIPARAYDRLDARLALDGQIEAPVDAGEPVGRLAVTIGDETVTEQDIVALETIAEGGIISRVIDELLLWLE